MPLFVRPDSDANHNFIDEMSIRYIDDVPLDATMRYLISSQNNPDQLLTQRPVEINKLPTNTSPKTMSLVWPNLMKKKISQVTVSPYIVSPLK